MAAALRQNQQPVRETIVADHLSTILRRRPGLLLGPGSTLGPGCLMELARSLGEGREESGNLGYFNRADALACSGVPVNEIRKQVRSKLEQLKPDHSINVIARTRWSAILSTCIDPYFEQAFQLWCDKSPLRRDVTMVTEFRRPVPPHTIPSYKLLGSIFRDDFVVTTNDYRVQQPLWHRPLRDFANAVQGAPVLCIGMAEFPDVLLDVLALMLSDTQLVPGPLLLLESDPVARNGQLDELASRGLRIVNVSMNIGAFISALQADASAGHTVPIPFATASQPPLEQLRSFTDLAVAVNAHLTSAIDVTEVNRLRDLLFSPSAPSWEPFVHDLDFARTVTNTLIEKLRRALSIQNEPFSEIIVRGASATGKTTVLKRTAFEIAKEGTLVVWLRPYFFQNGPAEVRKLCEQISASSVHGNRRLLIVADDPLSLGTVRVEDVVAALRDAKLQAVLVLGARSTDLATSDADLQVDFERGLDEFEIPDRFDEAEWKSLPEYLVRLGIAPSIHVAQASTSNAPGRSTRDVLGMLYWLLPETRSRITESVRDEYLRLGDRVAFSQVIIGEFNHTSDLVKNAYSLVAAAAKYGTPVPMEVLVSAIGIRYEEWLDATGKDGLLWGLLYQETSEDGETTVYRTRNDVVTDIVVNIVNGGALSRAGELSLLGRLLSACNGNSPVYREFCARILVPPPGSRAQLETLEYAEGLELFEKAINSLPFEDRTLLHHMGRWEKNKGQDPSRARTTLQRALKAQVYPYATRGEATEYIHTTLAATELDAIRRGQIPADEGKERVMSHLERARAGQFFNNPNPVHVQAKLIAELADLMGKPSDPDSIAMIGTALADVDRMILLLRSEFVVDAQRRANIECLEQVRGEVLNRCLSMTQLGQDAERLWKEFRRQDGFVLVARRHFGAASASNKGTAFYEAFKYCQETAGRIASEGEQLSHDMAVVMLHVYFRWRVRRGAFSSTGGAIDWGMIESLAGQIVSTARSRNDPLYSYVLALARAHLGDWAGSNAIFDELRSRGMAGDVLYEPRDFLMSDNGGMRTVQGVVHHGARKNFLHVESLGTDFYLDRSGKWPRDGETAHAYVRFRFAGPVAIDEP